MSVSLNIGSPAPDFKLPNQDGKLVSLNQFIGKSAIVLYFYPKDNTPGCTTEACTFRDQYEVFKEHGATVIGISSDSVESHKDFVLKYNLPFTILSDKSDNVRKLYGVKPSLGLIPGRVTYIIDKKGIIRYIFSSQFKAKEHVEKSLEILLELEAEEQKTFDELRINI